MELLNIKATDVSPEILLDPANKVFHFRGNSAPEDVRTLYYPVVEWIKSFVDDILNGGSDLFNSENPFTLQIDLSYFNSSSAKFFHDIFFELRRLINKGVPVRIEWFHEEEDLDMLDAGTDMSILAGYEFRYISKNKTSK